MNSNKILGALIIVVFSCCSITCGKTKTNSVKGIQYELSNDIFPNPERGFMHLYSVSSEGDPLSEATLRSLRAEHVTIIHRMYYLEKFKDKLLSEAELKLMRTDLERVRAAGIKAILVYAYCGQDDVWNTEKGQDAPFTTIDLHLDQLKTIFEENKDVIAFVQAGFIGPWGEWHSSTNGLETPYYMTKVLDKMLSVIPKEIMVQVRTPKFKHIIFGTTLPVDQSIAYSDEKRSRVGHYNDCFMASADDYGTYTNVQVEKKYISDEGLFVPAGGETCPPVPANNTPGCPEATSTMRFLRWTYLNLDWYKPTIASWKAAGCFEELERNLGYRLALETANFPDAVSLNQEFNINITIINKGYAPLYNYKVTSLVLKNKASGEIHEIRVPVDLRECKPSGKLEIDKMVKPTGIAQGNYELYLKIHDNSENLKNRTEYSVRLANTNGWVEENGGMNTLRHQLKIGD